jgi:hypothetical protein
VLKGHGTRSVGWVVYGAGVFFLVANAVAGLGQIELLALRQCHGSERLIKRAYKRS